MKILWVSLVRVASKGGNMEQLTIIEYNGVSIQVFGMKHNPYFSGLDVAKALGYSHPMDALRRYVETEDKTIGDVVVVNEYGVYSLIANSGNKEGKRFFIEYALPQVHKNGKYKPGSEVLGRKKYVRLYELASGEKLSKIDLKKRALSLGMPRSEANRCAISQLERYINDQENKVAKQKEFETVIVEYPYSYDEADEISQYNLINIMHVLPDGSYKTVCGVSRFNEEAIAAIKMEISRWK